MNTQQNQISDEELLKLIAQANKAAFSRLMQRHLSSVISFAMKYFPQRSDAEDIAQETFIRLWCKAPIWHDKGISVKAWLYRVAYNQCIDQLRKRKIEYQPDCDDSVVDEMAFIEKIMDIKSNLAIQDVALAALPERQKTAIALCAIKGFSNYEAAGIMNISVEALESLLARGRRKLKKLYHQAIKQAHVKRETVDDFY